MNKFYLPLNLQLFAEDDDDMMLPDDYVESPPQEDEAPADEQEQGTEDLDTETEGEDTTPPEEPTEPPQEPETHPQKLKIKFNKEERELDLEEAAALAQKGLNYDKAVERAAQEARDAVIKDMGYSWNGKPITTEAEYKQALMEKEIQEKYADLPDDVRQELIESKRFREEYERGQQTKEQESKQQKDFDDFFAFFNQAHGRYFDPKTDKLPQEVMDAVENGVPMKYAYMEHYNKELQNQVKIAKQNQTNKSKAPVGSVTTGGSAKNQSKDPFEEGFDEDDY